MIFDHIELRHIKLPFVTPFETSLGMELFVEHIIIRVDGEGITG